MDDDDDLQSADDALEPQSDIFNPLKNEDKLAEDNNPPLAPPGDIDSRAPIDDPETDDGTDSDELYQEGVEGATSAYDEEINPDESPKPLDGYDES